MRIVVHGGMHKTGTKSMQQTLSGRRDKLVGCGVLYPASRDGTHGRLLDVRSPGWSTTACQELVRRAESAGVEVLFLSSEIVSLFSERQFAGLQAAFAGHDLRYVFCLRDWTEFLPSRWVQNSMRRDSQTFEAYVAAIEVPEPPHVDLRYDLVLDRAVRGTGAEVVAVSMTAARRSQEGLVGTILRAAALNEAQIEVALAGSEATANQRPPWQVSEVCRLLNGVIANSLGLPQNDLCRSIAETRACEVCFDLASWLPQRAPRLWRRLLSSVDEYGKEIQFVRPAATGDVVARLENFRPLFFNHTGGSAAAAAALSTITLAAVDWKQFAATHADLVQALLQGIGAG